MLIYIIIAMAALVALILLCLFLRKVVPIILEKLTYWDEQNQWLKDEFRRCNAIIFGKKGSGKDVLNNHVINQIDEPHYANMPYNELTEVRPLDDLSVGENTFDDFMNGTVKKIEPKFAEGTNFYISDAGIYLPSQYDKELDERYPSMPIFFALSRQLHNMCIHANVQSLGRIWKKLREQADTYIWVRRTEILEDCLIVHFISYDRYESASRMLLPSKDKQYCATNGEIIERKIKVMKKDLMFDTRYFQKVLFDIEEHNKLSRLEEIKNYGFGKQ